MTDRPPPIAALAPERTIYVSSFGKSISPALRIGYMVVPPALVEQLEGTQRAMNLAVPPVVAEIASTLMAKGTAEEIAQQYLAETAKRQAAAAAILSGHEFRAHPAAFFLWLALPPQWRSDEFVAAAQREGVNVVGAENFIVGRSRPADAVRISVNGVASLETMRRGLQTLVRLLESQPKFAIV
jgi:DNA-binding transcriptional MocR family regulator